MEPETVVACECGKKVRLPVGLRNRVLRCPGCKSILSSDPDVGEFPNRRRSPAKDVPICQICQTDIAVEESIFNCPECGQIHHLECWSEIGGCGTYGCSQGPVVVKQEIASASKAWGDTKQCPVCCETIKSISVRCRFCNTDLGTTDPLTREDFIRKTATARTQSQLKANSVVLFVLSLLGLTAPLAGLISSAYLLPRLDQLSKCGPLYAVLAWASLLISGLYTVLITVFFVFEWT